MRARNYCAVAATVFLTFVAVVVVSSPIGAATNCTSIHFIGAGGSGGEYRSMARTSNNLKNRIEATGLTFSSEQLNYAAKKIPVIQGDFSVTWVDFVRSIEDGYTKARATALKYLNQCKDSNLVFAGYSQGAMVIHRMLQLAEYSSDTGGKKILSRIAGVLLLADGDRQAFDRNISHRGGASLIGQGAAQAIPALSKASSRQLSRALGSKTISWCKFADPVCDLNAGVAGGLAGAGWFAGRTNSNALKLFYAVGLKAISEIHEGYKADDWDVQLANVVKANTVHPTPPSTTTPPPSTTSPATAPSTSPGVCARPVDGDLDLTMPAAKFGEPYDEVWRVPAWEGCAAGWTATNVLSPLDYHNMRYDPVYENGVNGKVTGLRVYGTPTLEQTMTTARFLGIDETTARSGPVTLRAYNELDGVPDEFNGTVCWGVLDDNGTYPCNR